MLIFQKSAMSHLIDLTSKLLKVIEETAINNWSKFLSKSDHTVKHNNRNSRVKTSGPLFLTTKMKFTKLFLRSELQSCIHVDSQQ